MLDGIWKKKKFEEPNKTRILFKKKNNIIVEKKVIQNWKKSKLKYFLEKNRFLLLKKFVFFYRPNYKSYVDSDDVFII